MFCRADLLDLLLSDFERERPIGDGGTNLAAELMTSVVVVGMESREVRASVSNETVHVKDPNDTTHSCCLLLFSQLEDEASSLSIEAAEGWSTQHLKDTLAHRLTASS